MLPVSGRGDPCGHDGQSGLGWLSVGVHLEKTCVPLWTHERRPENSVFIPPEIDSHSSITVVCSVCLSSNGHLSPALDSLIGNQPVPRDLASNVFWQVFCPEADSHFD